MAIDPFFAIGIGGFLLLIIVSVIRSFKFEVNHDTATAPLEKKHSVGMGTPPINEETEKRIALLFAPEDQQIVRTVLRDECGTNLPGLDHADHRDIERIRFSVLKLSKGKLDNLEKAMCLAKVDWRDAMCAAGFGWKPDKHKSWLPRSRTEPTALSHLLRWWGDKH
jgi:hypothetical protein